MALADYSAGSPTVTRFTVRDGQIASDELDRDQLCSWVDGCDPLTGDRRGRLLASPDADLVLDGTINAPKSYSLVTLLHPELAREFEALQDRLRDRVIIMWQRELNARRGAGGRIREDLVQVEVVELKHRRSRALDPHIHRHLWLNVRVQGRDGQWSNVDSRVAMKMHTLINAEGELAARTDPEWIAALARHGYSLNESGEVVEVAHAVRPLSRRSNQIEKNRAVLLARWRQEHPGQEPGRDVLQQIDRKAWAQGRPAKPTHFDEDAWEQLVLDELADIDPALTAPRPPMLATAQRDVDVDLFAARAIVDADARAAASGGRFSMFDVRAGATRALAASGIVATREQLQDHIDHIVERAMAHTVDLIDGDRPAHVKGHMAASTASLKVELAARFDALHCAGGALSPEAMQLVAGSALGGDLVLEAGQASAAGAIAGSDRLVTVTGPAGTGKTTTLRVARHALALQGRQMVVVAPTKKAASVAAREVGATASSLHALLADHGWRWSRDAAGAERWERLQVGETDAATGMQYRGPTKYPLAADDRIVVDEAGMVDLHTATALATLAGETGAGIAMVGDHLQAMPVGHSGAMACMARRSSAVVELTAVHRFRDPEYAELTLRLREPGSREAALAVADDLAARGLVTRVSDSLAARDAMVEGYFRWSSDHKRVALVTGTNDEADAINDAIQERRLELGQLRMERIAVGQGEQRILEGDVVQTRRNDRAADVENRALWTVRSITSSGVVLASVADSADVRTVSADYVADHVHLAYASTVHGIQGETTDASIVGPGVDASGLYVGMTRGRVRNEVIAVARTDALARDAIADSMMRGTIEVTIDDARRAALTELRRAALPPEEAAAWSDRDARPYGAVDGIDRLEAMMREDIARRRAHADPIQEWLAGTEMLVAQLEAEDATTVADTHGRSLIEIEADDTAAALRERRIARAAELATAEAGLAEAEATLARVVAERELRHSVDPAGRAREERDRALAAAATGTVDRRSGIGLS
ncbi:AAA family ATPase [Microbacter sp. GSS18]|nr:AAA family ATPase [Microbacter sp. GSS18]